MIAKKSEKKFGKKIRKNLNVYISLVQIVESWLKFKKKSSTEIKKKT